MPKKSRKSPEKINFRNSFLPSVSKKESLLSPLYWATYIYPVESCENDLGGKAFFFLSQGVDFVAEVNYLWTLSAILPSH